MRFTTDSVTSSTSFIYISLSLSLSLSISLSLYIYIYTYKYIYIYIHIYIYIYRERERYVCIYIKDKRTCKLLHISISTLTWPPAPRVDLYYIIFYVVGLPLDVSLVPFCNGGDDKLRSVGSRCPTLYDMIIYHICTKKKRQAPQKTNK